MGSIRRAALGILLALLVLLPTHAADAPLLDLAKYRGRVVVVDFWASWCVPCRRSIPWLNTMQEKYADRGLVVIGVNVDRERSAAEAFLAQTPARFPIVYDAEGTLPAEYGVMAMPSSYVFDRAGWLAAKHLGFLVARRDEYERVLKELLAEEGK